MNPQEPTTNTTQELLKAIQATPDSLQISCNDGKVIMNVNTFDFTYIGLWGQLVLKSVLKNQASNKPADKIIILLAHIAEYSKRSGGFTFTTQ